MSTATLFRLIVGLLLCLVLSSACRQTEIVATATPTPISLMIEPDFGSLAVDLIEAADGDEPVSVVSAGASQGPTWVTQGLTDIAIHTDVGTRETSSMLHIPLAIDGVAVITNEASGIDALSLADLRDIFGGQQQSWSAFGGADVPIQIVSREAEAGLTLAFEAAVLGDTAMTPNALVLPNSAAVIDTVMTQTGAVGFVPWANVPEGMQPLSIEGVTPTAAAVADRSYPLRQTLILSVNKETRPAVKQLVEFVLGPEGSALIEAQGFTSIE